MLVTSEKSTTKRKDICQTWDCPWLWHACTTAESHSAVLSMGRPGAGAKSTKGISMLGGCRLQAGQWFSNWAVFLSSTRPKPRSVEDRMHKDSIRAAFVSLRGAITSRKNPVE
eukprot:1159485-Pelagomonas_calceolata.AAC.4